MTKFDKTKGEKGKVKFRLVEFELEGSDATLQDALRNIGSAMTRGSPGTTKILTVHKEALPSSSDTADESPDIEADETTSEAPEAEAAPSRPRSSRKVSKPKPIDLDLISGTMPLKQFCEQTNPDSDTKKYLVIAYWLKEYRKINEITIDHVYTCFRHMGWNTPAAAGQPLNDMKRKRGWMDKAAAVGAYALNHLGENVVRGMLTTKA